MIEAMRANLKPQGTKPVVRLFISGAGFFNTDFVTQCIDEIENKTAQVSAGLHTFTPLERLAIEVLANSANIEESNHE